MLKRVRIALTALLLLAAVGVNAQVTTASMAGKVTDASNEPIIGATVQAVHQPSGSRYGTVTNVDGRYSIQGMRTGGPYRVEISYIGYQTVIYKDITLQLGEVYNLNVEMSESSELLNEVIVTAAKTKFTAEKTGATTNISSAQITQLPTVNRSISDIARLSPYANGMSFAGGDGRSTNFTIDGANFNNNFGLSSNLPGGGNPISMDAIEEVQVVVAPFDVRQTNFIGGGINAITKSGTNTFRGTAYTYYRNQDMRGNRINGEDLGARSDESKTTYGFTLGGPIIKNKLFFFVNYEKEKTPGEVIKYRAREDGEEAKGMVSRTLKSDMEKVYNHLKDKYGYDAGSYTSFPADEENTKILARIDWNITDRHRLSLRYNNTKNTAWNAPNGNSSDTGYRLNNTYRVGTQSMAFANSMYSMDNKVQSWATDLNSRFTDKISNQLLFTYTNIEDMRGTNSSPFPFIDIMAGKDENGNQILEPYMSAGYELFTYNNGVKNKITNITDNFTFFTGNHKLTAGLSYEHQFANNAYMRNGTGYYRYNSLEDFLSGAAPESFALTYGFNGVANPNAQVTFNQLGFYAQDEWNLGNSLKLTYGIRFDNLMFDNDDLQRNDAIYELDFDGQHIDTGKWPDSRWQISPRIGFVWDVFKDKSLKVRGGTGVFTGRLPLVFFTNMPTNASMVQNSVTFKTQYDNGKVVGHDSRLDQLAGGMITDMNQIIDKFNLPTTIEKHVAGSKISGVAQDFKMPQVWKSSIAVDYQVPVSFPLTVTGEFMFTKNVNAVTINNINIKNPDEWKYNKLTTVKGADGKDVTTTELLHTGMQRFNGADNRMVYSYSLYDNPDKNVKYAGDFVHYNGKNAVVLDNTSKGYGYTANITVNAQPVDDLMLMLAYTHTESKEVSGLPGSDPISTWQGLSLKVRGGTGVFTGRLPLVFFTNMPTNASMVQNSVTFKTQYDNGKVVGHDSRLDQLAGGMITDMNQIIDKFNLPTTIEKHVAGSKISGVAQDFKMPQVWKSSIAVDYQVPVSFPLTVTGEFMFTKNVNAVTINNINIKNPDEWKYNKLTTVKGADGKDVTTTELLHTGMQRFNGADNRMVYSYSLYDNPDKNVKYAGDFVHYNGKNAVVLDNTSKGYGYTANITVNAQPVDDLMLMLAYTHTESKEVSGLPGSDPISTWQGLNTIDGSNYVDAQRSQYVVPDKVIASVGYYIPFRHKGLLRGTHLNLFYSGYSSGGYSFCYTNDMNGDGINNDLMYIPKDDSEINFKTEEDRVAFWKFVEQDSYLKNHKGQYAEAYAARAPWVHRFDFRLLEDFEFKIGKTRHCFQLSFDIMNVGNLINSKWGISKTNTVSNSNRILKYEGVKSATDLTPVFSMYKVNGEYPTKTYDTYQNYSECWKLQVGIRYVFN